MNLRRLTPEDIATYEHVLAWERATPRFYRESENCFATLELADLLSRAATPEHWIDVLVEVSGVSQAVVSFEHLGGKGWEVYLSAPRQSSAETIIAAGRQLIASLFADGIATEIVAWIIRRNRGARRVLEAAGFAPTGTTYVRGKVGRLFEWELLRVGYV